MNSKNVQGGKSVGPQKEIKISDTITGAEYANTMQVFHSAEEFRLLFAHIFDPTGKVVSKVTTTPAHFKRMVGAMTENLARYEKTHGVIKDVSSANEEKIGFE